jgi:hypothetical protein
MKGHRVYSIEKVSTRERLGYHDPLIFSNRCGDRSNGPTIFIEG